MLDMTQESLIGYVTEVNSNEMLVLLKNDDPENDLVVTLGDEDIQVGKVGAYILVKQKQQPNILAMITRMREQEKPSGGLTGGIQDTITVKTLAITPLGSVDSEGLFIRGVSSFPTTGAEVHAVGSKQIGKMFEHFKEKEFDVGRLPSNLDQKVYFNPTPLFGRHFAILGQTGSGKSYAVANLIQKAVKTMPEAHIILLDLHGEYSWINDKKEREYAFDEKIVHHVDTRDLEIPYWLMTYAELCDLLIDHTEREATNQTAFFRDTLFNLKMNENDSFPEKHKLNRVSVDTPIHFSLNNLLDKIREENERKVQGSRGEKNGPLFGVFDRFLIRIESKMNDIRYDFLLKPKKRNASDQFTPLLKDFIGLGNPKRAVTIIDMSSIPFDVRPIVAAQIGRIAFEFNYWNPKYKDFPILLICEEAHAYIPRDSNAEFSGARKSMERIAKEGRKYGVGLGVVSQRPNELSETVLAQCGSFLCLRITNPTDQAYVRNLVPEAERNMIDILASLGRGEAMALGEAVPLPTRVQFYRPCPTPNSDDIDFYQKWKIRQDDLDVDLIVDRWRKQERSE